MSNNTGGPAFPAPAGRLTPITDQGMTLRDYFAAKAMAALVVVYTDDKAIVDEYSQRAYAIADAMMKAREA